MSIIRVGLSTDRRSGFWLLFFHPLGQRAVAAGSGDEPLPWNDTVGALGDYFPVYSFEGGSHRVEHMEEALKLIWEYVKD
ncbi:MULTISPECIES: hypothetical protein [Marinobacter]|uniref:hypothetical protein n=1 Tax=Marinobacter TaxID=2742 RepID=UPI0004B5F8A4|nr:MULTISPECIES: hypothetical protein [unclassified Marinobacter]|tara:strand:- start:1695 stop:1934 length:240 start_codon:yes stop_codon:yes gene_type:complete